MLAALLSIVLIRESRAGGPLLVTDDGRPVGWAKGPVRGGTLNSMTVDEQGRVIYRVDAGNLGPIGHEMATHLVDRIFGEYSSVETSTIRFVNGGAILDPRNGKPLDVTYNNAGLVLSSRSPSYQNPIVFDSDGSISGGGGVLGIYGLSNLDEAGVKEGFVVLNGAAVQLVGGNIPFFGIFTHEFGHFAGPLDHSQVSGRIAVADPRTVLPAKFSPGQLFDLFTPFMETLYPFAFTAPALGSSLAARGFDSSGYFVATLDLDTRNALSNLYPAPGYLTSDPKARTGSIAGRVLIHATDVEVPVTGLNVVARRISRSSFPPSVSTEAFPRGAIPLDQDGVPLPPPDRDETDSLATATSVVTGYVGPRGYFRLDGLPPGEYSVYVEEIDPLALGGSSIGPFFGAQLRLFTPEFYSGPQESNDPKVDDPMTFVPVTVQAGATTAGIDIELNEFGGTLPAVTEMEPNDATLQAQSVASQVQVMGMVAAEDPAVIRVNQGPGFGNAPVQDLYRLRVSQGTHLAIVLQALDPSADIDLYLFNGALRQGVNQVSGGAVLAQSISNTGQEMIFASLPAATSEYYIGVSGFFGSTTYRLLMFDANKFTPGAAGGASHPAKGRSPMLRRSQFSRHSR